jgi:hypothetical protein
MIRLIKWMFRFPKKKDYYEWYAPPQLRGRRDYFKMEMNADLHWALATIWHFVQIQFLLVGVFLVVLVVGLLIQWIFL